MKRHQGTRVDEAAPPLERAAGSDVAAWRLRRLVEAGFPVSLALDLATTPGLDLHALLDLVDRGCPPDLAARIMSPVDDAEGWA